VSEVHLKKSDELEFSDESIIQLLKRHYDLNGELKRLASYCDLNFLLSGDQRLCKSKKSYIVKLSRVSESINELEMQNEAMNYLHSNQCAVPQVLPSLSGDNITLIHSLQGKQYYLRLLTYLEGNFYAEANSHMHTENLWRSLGEFMGNVDRHLSNFHHPAACRFLDWDLAHGFGVCQAKKKLLKSELIPLVDYFLLGYQDTVFPLLTQLPQGIIHNDANDYNLLIDNSSAPQNIIGLIDFGDMVTTQLINELAITCAYAIMGQSDILKVIKTIAVAYHQKRPLIEQEIKALYSLIALRLCTTLCNSALAIQQQPDNEYLLISVKPAIDCLNKLKLMSACALELALLQACDLSNERFLENKKLTSQQIIDFRKQHLGKTLSLSYQEPIKMVRGKGAYLYDENGQAYLDMVNNVCHVGHCHPKVVAAGQKQMAKLNTNTRYLHDNLVNFSEKLLSTFPKELSVCMFVNSGSEANELAMRLAECHTGSKELIVVEGAYHGNTSACINASPYKFDGPGGKGAEPHVHMVALPDPYRGKYLGNNQKAANAYAQDVKRTLGELSAKEKKPCAFICESLQGVAGQVIMPNGYLAAVYPMIRAAGGVCIADEVQVGFGRVGTHMWAFETQNVVPDIITLGKPIGNGHPLAAVIMKKEIADSFVTGMEYFNTFGGNPVSCAIGSAVLDVIEQESLQHNALEVGKLMMLELAKVQQEYELIGDVRGLGLFIGVELVEDRRSKKPATEKMSWLIEFFKKNHILLTSEGPGYNILKIKPPIVFSKDNAYEFIRVLRQGLNQLLAG
jgi:4-aminobutyrate aminotransferase-like enzyme/Ser/Thr protein kinase RdoA (MazF antagonist)